jgi:hypothetical protein
MKLLYLLEPGDIAEFPTGPPRLNVPAEYDFIQHYYGKPNMTHRWNEFRLRPSVVDSIKVDYGRQLG